MTIAFRGDFEAINANPAGSAIVKGLMGKLWEGGTVGWTNDWFRAYSTAAVLTNAKYSTLLPAIKAVKNFTTDQQAWQDMNAGWAGDPPINIQPYINDINQKYSEISNRTQGWKAQSKVGLGRGTILTGGRGVRDQAQTQQSRLKTKLG